MTPRDEDGYVDLDQVPDHESDLDLAAFGAPPPPSDAVWEIIVTSATVTDPAALGLDIDLLIGALQDTETTDYLTPEPDTDIIDEGDQSGHDSGRAEFIGPMLAPEADDDHNCADGIGAD